MLFRIHFVILITIAALIAAHARYPPNWVFIVISFMKRPFRTSQSSSDNNDKNLL